MEPVVGTKEARVLQVFRDHRGYGGSQGVEYLVEKAGLKDKKDLQRVFTNLRKLGFSIKSWWDFSPRELYGYSLEDEALAADPFDYLTSLIKNGRLEIFFEGYLVRVDWFPMLEGKTMVVQLFPKKGRSYDHERSEHHVIDNRGVINFGWDEAVSGAKPVIPTMNVRLSGVFPSQEEKMIIDHIRAHIVQNFIREALEKGRRRVIKSKNTGKK